LPDVGKDKFTTLAVVNISGVNHDFEETCGVHQNMTLYGQRL